MADNDSGPSAAAPDDLARAEEEPFCLPKKLEGLSAMLVYS